MSTQAIGRMLPEQPALADRFRLRQLRGRGRILLWRPQGNSLWKAMKTSTARGATMRTRSQRALNKSGKKPLRVLLHRPYDSMDGAAPRAARSATLAWDPAIDRWVNEGGALQVSSGPQTELNSSESRQGMISFSNDQ